MFYLRSASGVATPRLAREPGGQPINIERTSCLWHAGLIGNRAALARGHDLPDDLADADLLAALYLRCGSNLASKLTGTSAWIVWDSRRQALVAARDRIGCGTLYYVARGDALWISDKLEDLLPTLAAAPRPNPRAVVSYLNVTAPPPGETFYAEIHELQPGHLLMACAGKLEIRPYWRLAPQPLLRLRSDAEYVEAYRTTLKKVMREYVPAGKAAVTLSSGLDSTSVAAFLCAVAPNADLTALSWASPEIPEADESAYAREAAGRLGIPFIPVRADLAWTLRDPQGVRTGQASPFYLYYTELWRDALEVAARSGIRTIFTGVCGDDLFGANVFGYADLLLTGRWLACARQMRYHVRRSPVYKTWREAVRGMVIAPLLRSYRPGIFARRAPPRPWLRAEYHALWRELQANTFRTWRMLPGRQERLRMLDDRMIPPTIAENARLGAELGITFSHPLLDHRLVEFAASLPVDQTIRYGQRKIIVRNALRGVLPDSIVDMWGKLVPTQISMRGLYEREQAKVWSYLTDMRAAALGYVDEAVLQNMYRAFLSGAGGNDQFWYPLTLEDWLRRYF